MASTMFPILVLCVFIVTLADAQSGKERIPQAPTSGLFVCWFVFFFLLVCWFVGLLVCVGLCWFVLVCWFVGLLVCWFVGLLVLNVVYLLLRLNGTCETAWNIIGYASDCF